MVQRTSYAQGTPNWIDIQSPDVEASKHFYGTLFGWNHVNAMGDDGTYWMADLGGLPVAAISGHNPENTPLDAPARWNTYIAADSADDVLGRVAEAGGTVMMEAFDIAGAGRMGWAADPSGADFGVWQGAGHIGSVLVNEPGALTWNELVTNDQATALPFYEKVFGVTTKVDDLGGMSYTSIFVGGESIAGSVPPPMPTAPNHWHVYFAAADTDATVAAAKELGASVIVEPFDLPVGRTATLQDPQGAYFSVIQLAPTES